MDDTSRQARPAGVSRRALDIAVAIAFMSLAAIVMFNSWRVGMAWGADGPRSGYFPFYIALLMFLASAVTLVQAVISRAARKIAIEAKGFRPVLALLVPTIVYAAAIAFLGIYVSSALYLAYFTRVLGRYRIDLVVALSVAIPFVLFVLFEVWFLVPLPKGPLEAWLGY